LRLVGVRDADAFDELYRRHAWAVAAVASRVVADRADADDATQAAFMRLWDRAGSIDARGGSLRPWLVTVGRNAALDRVRRRRPVVATDEIHERIAATELGPEEIIVQRDVQRDIHHALEALDPQQRAVVELAFLAGLRRRRLRSRPACRSAP